ncbi:MAG TPA: ATP-binding protein, partial [Gemmatimonadales bacterium]|nr:ATP-binding protein [Gemmatimonadales bacterium]
WAALRLRHRLVRSEQARRQGADELNRRLSEVFSLQELSYVLSESLELERIATQVVRYAMRFLDARGALVALANEAPDQTQALRVVGAEGTLAALRGVEVPLSDPGLVARSLGRERLELVRNPGNAPTLLAGDVSVDSAAVVPLRSHSVVVGSLVVVEPRSGDFPADDLRLLSTVATHAAIALANARFFDIVRRAKDQWETAFDALSEGIAVVDGSGRIRRANRALATLLDTSVEAVIDRDLGGALLGEAGGLDRLLAAGGRDERPPPLVTRSASLRRTLRINVARIPTATPEQSVVVLIEDVTDEQAIEAQLIQGEKLAAVGQLVSGVAHELNNPLTSIAGLTEFLLEQKELGAKDRSHLRVIHEQAERAGRIVRNLLTFARKGPGERALVDLNDVIQRTLVLMSYDLKLKAIAIEKQLAAELPPVLGDRNALQQVILNLLTNAAQAVSTNSPDRPRTIQVTSWFDEGVRVRVADSGPGIPDDVLPHLFTPFFTTKEPGAGTGLGLSITYSIIESHSGHISVERPPEGGAAFVVELPPATDTPASDAVSGEWRVARTTPPGTPAVKRSILLVDDDPAVRRVVKALFGREGHTVDVARNPAQALDMARARGYDLILADAQATARGQLFVEALIEANPGLKDRTLVATGDVRPATEETVERLGLRYLRKPFILRDLLEEAARVWAATTLS